MCVILLAESQRPSLEILTKCNNANSHGIGIAWINKNEKVQYKKGIELNELYNLIQDLSFPFSVHFRLASSGGKSELLCHPFEITRESELKLNGECDKVLMHNGHIYNWKEYLAATGIYISDDKELMSDSRAIAMIAFNNEKFLSILNGCFVIIDSLGKKFRMFGDFKEEEGIHYSNMFWKFERMHSHIFNHEYYEHYCNEESYINSIKNISRKERRRFWKKYTPGWFGNEETVNNNPQLPTRIHEQPPEYNKFSDNTQKILGYKI